MEWSEVNPGCISSVQSYSFGQQQVGGRYAALGVVMVGGRTGVIEMGAVTELEEVAVVAVLVNVPELEAVGPGCRAVALARRAASSVALRPPVGMPRSRHSRTMVVSAALSRSVASNRASGVDISEMGSGPVKANCSETDR